MVVSDRDLGMYPIVYVLTHVHVWRGIGVKITECRHRWIILAIAKCDFIFTLIILTIVDFEFSYRSQK